MVIPRTFNTGNMSAQKSIIRKATVSIAYNGKTDGTDLQRSVNNWWDKIIAPEIEALVKSMDNDIYVHIPDLCLDIAVDSTEDWQQITRRQVLSKLEQAIATAEKKAVTVNTIGQLAHRKEGALRKTPSQRFLDEWLFFLKTGFMPWWGSARNAGEWTAALKNYIQHTAVADDVRELVRHITTSAVSDRFVAQLPGTLFWEFMELLAQWDTSYVSAVRDAEQALISAPGAPAAKKQQLPAFRKAMVDAAVANYSQKETLALLKSTAAHYTPAVVTAEALFRNAAFEADETDGPAESTLTHTASTDTGTTADNLHPDTDRTREKAADVQEKNMPPSSGKQDVEQNAPGMPADTGEHMGAAITAEALFAGSETEAVTTRADELLPGTGSLAADVENSSGSIVDPSDVPDAGHRPEEAPAASIPAATAKKEEVHTADQPQHTAAEKEAGKRKQVKEQTSEQAKKTGDAADVPGTVKTADELWSENTITDTAADMTAHVVADPGAGNNEQHEAVSLMTGEGTGKAKTTIAATGSGDISKQNKPSRPAATDNIKRDQLKKEMYAAAEEGIYIQNAGIVLAAGYLGAFFNNLGLAGQNAINDLPRAIALLHYLATGAETFAEFEVVLAKILCGVEPDEFVDTTYELTEADKQEADQLLQAVIDNWPALKNTSVEGLRGTFLVREGKLTHENGSWKLYVQEQPFDILIDMLPWSISMIYLPWMPALLRVSWRGESI